MSTRINHNILAMTAMRNIGQAQNSLDVAVNRLSSGLRINNAWDDAAGLAVSEKFRAQISGMTEAEKNANYNINLLSTAEGALSVIDEKLVRMRQLAVQASNGALTDTDRSFINVEFQQMKDEITRIANVTNYNGKKLIDGSLSAVTANSITGASNAGLSNDSNSLKFHIGANNVSGQDYYYVNLGGATASSLGLGGTQITEAEYVAEQGLGTAIFSYNSFEASVGFTTWSNVYGGADAETRAVLDSVANNSVNIYENSSVYNYISTDDNGVMWDIEYAGGTTTATRLPSSSGGSTASVNVLTTASAQSAIDQIDNAIQSKDTMRAFIGAMVNRLQNNILELQISRENSQASESMIRDTDVADEMSGFTRAQILFNTGISMLSQANSIPQSVASLIG